MTADSPWREHAWAADYLGICPRQLRRLMREAENPEDARSLLDIARVFWATQGSRLEQMLRRDLQRQPDPDADPGA